RSGEVMTGGLYSQEQIAAMLDSLDVTDFSDHDKWLRLMMACHHASNGDARSEFIEWSTGDPQYVNDADIIGRRWDSLHADTDGERISYKTLRKFVQDEGDPNTIPAEDASGDFEAVNWLEGGETSASRNANGLSYVMASEVTPENVVWLWPDRI